MSRRRCFVVAMAAAVWMAAGAIRGQDAGALPRGPQSTTQPNGPVPNPYRTIDNIAPLPEGRKMGSTNAVAVDSHNNVWVAERCGANSCIGSTVDPILEYDQSGKLLRSFGKGLFVFPHGIYVDKQDNVWVIDAEAADGKGNQIIKFSLDGRILLRLGKAGVGGVGPDEFNQPSDFVFAPSGDLYIADGHIEAPSNARIVHLSKDLTFLEAWGTKGTAPGQFDCPHAIALDSRGRVFVGDRTNNRIQVFDPHGKFIAEWKQFGRPSGVRIVNDVLYVTDSESQNNPGGYGHNPGWPRGIWIGTVDGKVTGFIPDPKPSGGTSNPEGIFVDPRGTIYGASVGGRTVTKYVRK
jgi:hypothetical protein